MPKEIKDKDFAKLYHFVVDEIWRELSFSGKAVYIVLLRRADYKSRKCYPSVGTIARESGISHDSATRGVRELRERGLVEIKRGGPGIGFCNIYTVLRKPTTSCPEKQGKRESNPYPEKHRKRQDSCQGKHGNAPENMGEGWLEKEGKREGTTLDDKTTARNRFRDNSRDIEDGSSSAMPEGQAEPEEKSPLYSGETDEDIKTLRMLFSSLGRGWLEGHLKQHGKNKEQIEGLMSKVIVEPGL